MAKNIEISHKNKRIKIIIQALRAVAVLALLGVIIYVAVRLRKHPELASSENIVKLVSPNQIIATMEFILLYMLKGISFVFPSAVLNIASGMIFDFPFSILVSCLGIFVEFSVLYILGRFLGKGIIEECSRKYPIVRKVDIFQKQNSLFTGFIIRIIGLVSYDVGSIYLGASGVKYGSFILGSMLGALLNIVIDGLFGRYIFHPLCWQLWAVVGLRIVIVLVVFLGKKYISKNN